MDFKSTRRGFLGLMTAGAATLLEAQTLTRKGAALDASVTPERILLNISADPAHEQTITWRTERQQTAAVAQLAEASGHPDFEAAAVTIKAESSRFEASPLHFVYQHVVRLSGLKAGARYCYRVGDGATWSEWFEFRTAALEPAPFRFLYLGDEQNNIRSLCSRAMRAAFAMAPDARFLVHAGDLVAEGYDDLLWGEWFDALGYLSASVPSLPVPGNHDMHPGTNHTEILDSPPNWRAQFALPRNGPTGAPELDQHSYFVDYQGLRVIALDVNVYANEEFSASAKKRIGQAQTAWLESVLRDNPNPWTIVVQHQPIYTVSRDRDYVEMRELLRPLYERYRVALVLQGHDHAYARTYPLKDGKPVAEGQGVIYAISVSGPKMYPRGGQFASLMAREVRNTQMFQVIEVTPESLHYTAYDIEQRLLDEFWIRSAYRE